MKNELTITSHAKVNLFLELLGKRKNGYFPIETILQEVDLHDDVLIKDTEEKTISVEVSPSLSISREDNIAYKAAKLLQEETGQLDRGVDIFINKRIPVGRGLGGGSSNAAAVLKGLNELWNLKLSPERLADLGAKLGMDVPFFIFGGTCLGTQRGEVVKPLDHFSGVDIALFWPDFAVSTAEIYNKISHSLTQRKRSAKFLIGALKEKEFAEIDRNLFNRLEEVTLKIYPSLFGLKKTLNSLEIGNFIMSGSGSAFFSILYGNAKEKGEILRGLTKIKGGFYIGKTV